MDLTGTMRDESAHEVTAAPSWSRRTLLQASGAGAALAFTGRDITGEKVHRGGGQRARNRQIAGRLLGAIAAADTTAIWSLFAPGGYVELPFLGLLISDAATLEATVGPLLDELTGLTFTAPTFVDLDDEQGIIAKFNGHAVVASTGKTYDQTYISEIRVRRNKIASYTEYFDTAVLNEAFTP